MSRTSCTPTARNPRAVVGRLLIPLLSRWFRRVFWRVRYASAVAGRLGILIAFLIAGAVRRLRRAVSSRDVSRDPHPSRMRYLVTPANYLSRYPCVVFFHLPSQRALLPWPGWKHDPRRRHQPRLLVFGVVNRAQRKTVIERLHLRTTSGIAQIEGLSLCA